MSIRIGYDISRWFTEHCTRNRLSRSAFIVSALSAFSLVAAPSTNTVKIGDYGKLQGALNGYAWVAGAQQAMITTPNPCNNNGCFRNTAEQLCTKGHINALSCSGQGTSQVNCNWAQNWGVVLGLNTTDPQGPWGASAPTRVAVNFTSVARAGSAGHYRLNAHLAGDPYTKQYCVDNYTPGAMVQASDFKSQCWFNAGDTLPNFRAVDQLGLLRTSEFSAVDFDFCVTRISTE